MAIPDFLTVPEAAKVLRLGRTAAYELAARFEATGGAEGIPVIRLGRQFRVPRAQLEVWAGAPLTETAPTPATTEVPPSPAVPGHRLKLRPVPSPDEPQSALPFGR